MQLEQVNELIKEGLKGFNPVVIEHQQRLKFHGVSAISRNTSTGVRYFEQYAKARLYEDKWSRFQSMISFPVETNANWNKCLQKFNKVWSGKDAHRSIQIMGDQTQDYEAYRGKIDLDSFYKNAFEKVTTEPNTIAVVDMPTEQGGTLPEPYIYCINPNNIRGYKATSEGIQYVAWEQDNKLAFYCSEYYRVFEIGEKGDYSLVVENEHDLGRCPAAFVWTDDIEDGSEAKKGPFSAFVTLFDRLLFKQISKDYFDLYGYYPVTSIFERSCDYKDGVQECDGGLLRSIRTQDYIRQVDQTVAKCPKCNTHELAGPGSIIEVPLPSEENNFTNLMTPLTFTSVDAGNIERIELDLEKTKIELENTVTGAGGSSINDKAVNEKQVGALFESQEAVLKGIQSNLETFCNWAERTVAELRYGKDRVMDSVFYLGSKFYTETPEMILEQYHDHKEKGLPSFINMRLIEKFKSAADHHDNKEMRRSALLCELEPFIDSSVSEVMALRAIGVASEFQTYLKANFQALIRRFERENGEIINFGVNQDKAQRIETINEVLFGYFQKDKNGNSDEEE